MKYDLEEGTLSRKFGSCVKVEGKAFSAAKECKRLMEMEGGKFGATSVVKSEKRESNRKIREHHYWVRGPDENLSALKYESPQKFTQQNDGVMAMYHVYSCFEMGVQWIGFRRIPCNCLGCRNQIRKPWINGIDMRNQPRFQIVSDCKYRNYLTDKNSWHFFKLEQRTSQQSNHQDFMDEEANLFRKNIRDLIGEEINAVIEEGKFGAIVCSDKNEINGYYIVEWLGVPWTDQETRDLLCQAIYWNSVPRAPGWYTRSNPEHIETHLLNHVISADLELNPISDSNKLPNGCAKASATRQGAMKLSADSHDFIMEEIIRGEALEHIHSDSSDDEKEGNSTAVESSSGSSSSISSSSEDE